MKYHLFAALAALQRAGLVGNHTEGENGISSLLIMDHNQTQDYRGNGVLIEPQPYGNCFFSHSLFITNNNFWIWDQTIKSYFEILMLMRRDRLRKMSLVFTNRVPPLKTVCCGLAFWNPPQLILPLDWINKSKDKWKARKRASKKDKIEVLSSPLTFSIYIIHHFLLSYLESVI